MGSKKMWYNYQTESYDALVGAPTTDEEAEKYLQQGPMVSIYQIHRELGDTILDAMEKALTAGLSPETKAALGIAE